MATISDLKPETARFFSLHWPASAGNEPVWLNWDPFLVGPAPHNGLGGCYALFEEGELIYIGKAIAKGGGATPGYGISRRLANHVVRRDWDAGTNLNRLIEPWLQVTSIYTIGFPRELEYLALALEGFLIREFSPKLNALGRKLGK